MSEQRKSPRQRALNASQAKAIWDACTHVFDDVDVADWTKRHGGYHNYSETRALPQDVTSNLLWHRNFKATWFEEGHKFILPTWEIDGSFAGIAARQVYVRNRTTLWVTTEFNQHQMMFLADSVARACMATPIEKHAKHCTVNVVFLHTDYLRLLSSGATCVVMALAKAWTKDMVARFGERVDFKLHGNDEPKGLDKTLALIKSFEDAFRSIATNSMSMKKEQPFGRSESRSKSQRSLPWSAPPDLLDYDPPYIFNEPDLDDDPPPPALAKLTPTQNPQAVSAEPLRPAISRSLRKRKGRQLADGTRDGARDVIQQNIYLPPELKQEMEAFRAARGEQISEFFCAAATARLAQERGLEQLPPPPPPPPPAHTDIPTLVTELLRASTESDDESRARMDRLRYSPRSRFQFTTNVGERLDRYLAERQVPKSQGRDAWLALNNLLDKVLPP
jgi:hypothetical protein